jgi:trk system potassium uptake protein TrkH
VTAVIAISIIDLHGGDVANALRKSAFQTASIQTTTGFGTDDFEQYPAISRILLFMLMFIGGSAGSTAGGIKVGRVMIILKAAFRELRQSLRPQEVRVLRVGNKVVPEDTLRSIAGFLTLFFLTYAIATVSVAALGVDAETSGSAVVASLANIGPGFGGVGPTDNYAELPYMVKSILTLCMLLGRLELMTLLAFLMPGAWQKR